MNFSTSLFLTYFLPLFLLAYFALPHKGRQVLLFVASLAFLAWGAPLFSLVVLASILIDYYLANAMAECIGKARKTILVFLLILNLGTLAYFKYTGFAIQNLNHLLKAMNLPLLPAMELILPLGISFIVFQKLSYLIDVYRKAVPPAGRFFDYALFIFFFPKILAGPIVRFRDFNNDLANPGRSTYEERLTGFFRFSLGLAKKMLIANELGVFADQIFGTGINLLGSSTAWMGAIAYTFQIYFDFSAYSDMAIGLGRIIGFRIPENFNNPYVSRSITEFWKRWHITLGTWLRDYLFLPSSYSFSRKLPLPRYLGIKADVVIYMLATMLTMTLCGLWHGGGWRFVFWGFYMGLIMSAERLFLSKIMKKAGLIPSVLLTFFFTIIGWVIFRSPSLRYAFDYLYTMFSFHYQESEIIFTRQIYVILVVAVVFSFIGIWKQAEKWQMRLYTGIRSVPEFIAVALASIVMFVIGLSYVVASGFNPFIYFRF